MLLGMPSAESLLLLFPLVLRLEDIIYSMQEMRCNGGEEPSECGDARREYSSSTTGRGTVLVYDYVVLSTCVLYVVRMCNVEYGMGIFIWRFDMVHYMDVGVGGWLESSRGGRKADTDRRITLVNV